MASIRVQDIHESIPETIPVMVSVGIVLHILDDLISVLNDGIGYSTIVQFRVDP